jgi:hypothetical protein
MRQIGDEAGRDRIGDVIEYNRNRVRFPLQCGGDLGSLSHYRLGLQCDQLLRQRRKLNAIAAREAIVDVEIMLLRPSEPFELLPKRLEARFCIGVVGGRRCQHADAAQGPTLLGGDCPRPQRRCRASAAKKRNELAPLHSRSLRQNQAY